MTQVPQQVMQGVQGIVESATQAAGGGGDAAALAADAGGTRAEGVEHDTRPAMAPGRPGRSARWQARRRGRPEGRSRGRCGSAHRATRQPRVSRWHRMTASASARCRHRGCITSTRGGSSAQRAAVQHTATGRCREASPAVMKYNAGDGDKGYAAPEIVSSSEKPISLSLVVAVLCQLSVDTALRKKHGELFRVAPSAPARGGSMRRNGLRRKERSIQPTSSLVPGPWDPRGLAPAQWKRRTSGFQVACRSQ